MLTVYKPRQSICKWLIVQACNMFFFALLLYNMYALLLLDLFYK